MDTETEKKSKLTAMHDLQFYSAAWLRAVTHARLVETLGDILGPNVELHHSTLHIKPPQTGHPFPMHQDNPFYTHSNGQYVDVLVHLDDTFHENFTLGDLPANYYEVSVNDGQRVRFQKMIYIYPNRTTWLDIQLN